jgi:hypothetical protein
MSNLLLRDYVAELSEYNSQGCYQTNLQNNPFNPFETLEGDKPIQSGIMREGMKRYYDNLLKTENATVCFPSIKSRVVFSRS